MISKLIFYSFFWITSWSWAKVAILHIPTSFELVAVDGEKIDDGYIGFIAAPSSTHALEPGEHTITLKYYEIWPFEEEGHENVQSKPFVISHNFEASKVYQVSFDEPKTLGAAEAFAKDPACNILPFGDLFETGSIDLKEEEDGDGRFEDPEIHDAPGIELVSTEIIDAVNQLESEKGDVEPRSLIPEGLSALDMLRFWWERANKDEKASFLKESQ